MQSSPEYALRKFPQAGVRASEAPLAYGSVRSSVAPQCVHLIASASIAVWHFGHFLWAASIAIIPPTVAAKASVYKSQKIMA